MNDTAVETTGQRFFVYLVESPSALDLYVGRGEGNLLHQAIQLNGINATLRLAINLEAFTAALHVGLIEAMNASPGALPILHISAHGFSNGIQLSSGEILQWADLRNLLVPLNEIFNGCLIVCMSTCEGYSGSRMAMVQDGEKHPFYAIIGNSDKPTWPETAIAFATLYHLIAKGESIPNAVNAMRIASGSQSFFETRATESQKGYLEYIAGLDTQGAKEELEQQVESSAHSENSKWSVKGEC